MQKYFFCVLSPRATGLEHNLGCLLFISKSWAAFFLLTESFLKTFDKYKCSICVQIYTKKLKYWWKIKSEIFIFFAECEYVGHGPSRRAIEKLGPVYCTESFIILY